MVEVSLLAASGLALGSAAVYATVANLLRRRKPSGLAGRANGLFALWWLALAGYTVVGTTGILAGAFGQTQLVLHGALLYLSLFLLCVALWALLYYLLFLFTGRSDLLAPLTAFYVLVFLVLAVTLTAAHPIGVNVGRFTTTLQYERPPTGLAYNVLVALVVFPQILGALAYGSLYFKLNDRTRRFRVAVVSGSIVVWFLSAYLATAAGVNQQDWWVITSRLMGLGAALAVLVAYRPPRILRERFGLSSLAEEAKATGPSNHGDRSLPSGGRPAVRPALRWTIAKA